jgi:hypothetical protein
MTRFLGLAFCLVLVSVADAGVVNPDSSYAVASFSCTFTGTYRSGEPKDVVTISPSHDGETLASVGITIRVFVRDDQGLPVAGIPAAALRLQPVGGCMCTSGNTADGPTGADGSTTFTGRVDGGRCGVELAVLYSGLQIATVPVGFNSPDMAPTDCQNEVHDQIQIATRYGAQAGGSGYSVCQDLNEDGRIDIEDLSLFASMRSSGAVCN